MSAAADNNGANDFDREAYFDGSPADTVLVGIGEELRSAYRNMTHVDQPTHLVDLAQKLDALIAGGGEER